MGEMRQRYSEEFKRETVRYVQSRAKAVPEIAEEINVPAGTIHKWLSKYRSFSNEPVASWEDLQAARHEVRELKEENEILKKAVHFFSKDPK